VARKFGVLAIRHRDASLPGGYTLDHSNEFLLLDREGAVIDRFPAGLTPEQLAKELDSAIRKSEQAS
jgi:cytochrome oxidase Cu insertion factor (SCO1/SenC/PrrC family)